MAAVVAASAAHCSAEEALLDAYDLQWKAIDIRLEKLRNECERMILEYEVEVKQQMYLRECEELMRQKQSEHNAQQAALVREQGDREAHALKETDSDRETQQQPVAKAKKNVAPKRKCEQVTEEVARKPMEEATSVATKPKAAKKTTTKKKVAIEEPVQRPISPPVYSPEDESSEEPPASPSAEVEPQATAVARGPDTELLEMLSQDQEYESEDYGDAPNLGLIHPQSPAMLSPKRLKKKAALEAAAMAKNASSPLRGGALSLADRIMNRIKTVAKQPLVEPEPLSDASISPLPVLTTPAKRALKRRKIAVLSSTITKSADVSKTVEKVAATNREQVAGAQTQSNDNVLNENELKKSNRTDSTTARALGNVEATGVASKKITSADTAESKQRRTTKKGGATSEKVQRDSERVDNQVSESAEADEHELGLSTKSTMREVGAITGRSKARQSAKLAALRAAAAEEEDDVAGFPDIKTPKVPRKKMIAGGKNKQISDLATKRAEFQQVFSDSTSTKPRDEENERPVAAKKRRRQDEVVNRKEPVELEFHTPKATKKKPKITRNAFPNDELNIMKSPVPLLRAKIAQKKKEELEAKKNTNKRTLSERDGVDEEDPGYGNPAAAVPAISLPASKKGPGDIAAAASDYASRWINSGLVTRAKKNAVKAIRKPATKSPKPASLWGAGPSFFDAFVNTASPAIPRLKSTSAAPKI